MSAKTRPKVTVTAVEDKPGFVRVVTFDGPQYLAHELTMQEAEDLTMQIALAMMDALKVQAKALGKPLDLTNVLPIKRDAACR